MRLLGAACLCLGLCLAPADAERDVFFFEDFEGDTTGWVKSEATKLTEAREVLKFSGEWAVERPSPLKGEPVSKGLVVKTPSALHAISYKFPSPFVFDEGREFVLQYEVKLQRSISCGGAYLKLLSAGDWSPGQFDDRTPYSLMFGPDKCEPSDRVHFIIRHENPRTGAVEEKHMKDPPKTAAGRMTSLYTLVVFPNSTFQILINQEEVRRGTLMEDFDPPFAPPREIDDPSDRKPFDWDDEERIPDPSAKKPEDWDEDEPMMIEDPASVKPEDWLDDEPELIPSPGAQRPAEWNEDEDGSWAPPMIDNPRCLEVSGCGVWRPPYKRNPRYRGRWRAPLIDNPAYRGQWRPRQMPNPDYFEVKHPNKFIPVDGIGFEIWTLHDGIHFDNILLADSLRAAGAVAERTWRVKRDNEKAALAELAKNDNLDQPRKILREYFETIKEQSVVYLSSLAQDPIQTVIEFPTLTAVFLLFPTLAFLILLLAFSPGGSKPFPRRELPEVEPDEGKNAAGQGSSPSSDKD